MLTKTQALDEARKQKEALKTISKWRRNLFVFTACLVMTAIFGITGGRFRGLGIAAGVLAAVSLLLMLAVDLSIRNGHRNVEQILRSLESVK